MNYSSKNGRPIIHWGYGEGWQIPEGKFQKATAVTEPGREFSKEKRVDGLFQTWILTPFLPLARSFVIQFKMCGSVTWQSRKLTGLGVLFQFWLPYDVHSLLTFTPTKESIATPAGSLLAEAQYMAKQNRKPPLGWLLNGVIFHLWCEGVGIMGSGSEGPIGLYYLMGAIWQDSQVEKTTHVLRKGRQMEKV